MTIATNPNDFAFDYTRPSGVKAPAAKKAGALSRWFDAYVARREASAMAKIAMYDPRLAREIQAAKDRAEWSDAK